MMIIFNIEFNINAKLFNRIYHGGNFTSVTLSTGQRGRVAYKLSRFQEVE